MRFIRRSCLSALGVFGLCCLTGPAQAQFSSGPGFGNPLTRKHVELHRKLPPVVLITGKSVGVAVQAPGTLKAELQSALEGLLTRSDSNIQVGGQHPDLSITCDVTHYDAPKLNTAKEGKVTTQTFTGAISLSFRIGEAGNGRIIRSGVATSQIDAPASTGNTATTSIHIPGILGGGGQPVQPSGPKLTSTMDAENALVNDVARQIASYIVNTDEVVTAYLATGGSLSSADKLATSNLWTRDLEELETLTPFSDPRADAYRLYNIGVANEALAYQAQDAHAAVKYLQAASVEYGKALASRSDEKYFLEPQNRIKTALAHYDAPAPGGNSSPENTASTSHPGSESPAAADHGLTDDDVIAMVQAKMDQANIIDNIQTAPKVNFDLSVQAQVRLLHNGINNQLLAAMKQKARSAGGSAGH